MAVVDRSVGERSCVVDLVADSDGFKTGLDAGYMFPGWGSRSFPRMDALRTAQSVMRSPKLSGYSDISDRVQHESTCT